MTPLHLDRVSPVDDAPGEKGVQLLIRGPEPGLDVVIVGVHEVIPLCIIIIIIIIIIIMSPIISFSAALTSTSTLELAFTRRLRAQDWAARTRPW